MRTQLIAMGSYLMGDDSVALHVVESITPWLAQRDIEVLLGETDAYYCFTKVKTLDTHQHLLIIIDATNYGLPATTVTCTPLKHLATQLYKASQHDLSLLDLIHIYDVSVNGYLIGIEIASVKMELGLSEELEGALDKVSQEVQRTISAILGGATHCMIPFCYKR